MYDLEMLAEMGFCHGVENYSRWLDGRVVDQPPYTLIDYFPKDFLCFVDESHVTVPQIGGMFRGDRRRKDTLVDYGFRLPSALDNRPLRFEEWEKRVGQVVFVSATPAEYELEKSGGVVVEQIIRPTGLIDPAVEMRPAKNQVEDLLGEIRKRVAARRPRARHDPDQAHGRGAHELLPGRRHPRALPALRGPDDRAHRDPARPAQRRVRRAGRASTCCARA